MRRSLAVAALLFLLVSAGGCTWQANRASQAVDFGSLSDPIIAPANGPGYVDGSPQDMRTKH
jgi:hypothetical protein